MTTAAEVAAGVDLSGRRVIVTGAASGIGVETARALAQTGARVTLAARDVSAGEQVAKDIVAKTGHDDVDVAHLDLADLASVDAFTAGWDGPLHVLVNSAGVMATPAGRTKQGWELQFGTNHMGHFALALGLHGALAVDGAARIVSVSSSGHGASPVVLPVLRAAPLRPVALLRAVQDGERAVRGRGHAALGRRRDHRPRPDAGRHLDQPAAPLECRASRRAGGLRRSCRGRHPDEDAAAGRRDLGPAGHLPRTRRRRRTLLRRLQRGRGRPRDPRPHRRARLRPRPCRGTRALGGVARAAGRRAR
ncbi:MAG: SDR family NAD(P)-dependent oxidoreductase [Actinomycetota bacterium]|nr:SDR family NAD(P)-dependent oxidoreductase [Actinomycetota bacterium]